MGGKISAEILLNRQVVKKITLEEKLFGFENLVSQRRYWVTRAGILLTDSERDTWLGIPADELKKIYTFVGAQAKQSLNGQEIGEDDFKNKVFRGVVRIIRNKMYGGGGCGGCEGC